MVYLDNCILYSQLQIVCTTVVFLDLVHILCKNLQDFWRVIGFLDYLCNSRLFVQRHMCHVQLKFMCKHGVDVDFMQHIG